MHAKGNVVYACGYLIYLREKTSWRSPLISAGSRPPAVSPIAEPVEYDIGYNRAVFSVSQNGMLVWHESIAHSGFQLEWFDRTGRSLGKIGQPSRYNYIAISPDGKKLASILLILSQETWTFGSMIWCGGSNRFTFDPSQDQVGGLVTRRQPHRLRLESKKS